MNLFDIKESQFVLDFEKSMQQFSNNAMKKIVVGKFKYEGKIVDVLIKGEVTTNGISSNKFGTKAVYSIGVRVDDVETDLALDQLRLTITEKFPLEQVNDFSYSPILKDEIIYFKLKPSANNREFVVKSNKKLDMKKLTDYPSNGTICEVTAQIQGWINLEDKKYGLMFILKSINFED
jgi:hypothetical protein